AFLATGLDYAESTVATVERELDARAAAWLAQQTQSCQATLVQHIQSDEVYFLQTRCLATRLEEMRVLAELLAKADPGVVKKAASAATGLPSLKACADVHALQGQRRLPEDPKERGHLEELEKQFVRSVALDDLGRYKDALALGEQVVKEAQSLHDEPLRARADWISGRAALHLGDYKGGEGHLMSSVWAAEASGADLVAARSASNLAGAEAFQGNFPPGHLWANLGRAMLQRGGGDDDVESLLDNNAGVLATNEGDFAAALALYTDAAAAAARSHGDCSMQATSITNLAVAHFSLGHVDEAASTVRRAVEMMEKSGGSSHPQLVLPLVNRAEFTGAAGDLADADASAKRAVKLAVATLGPEHAYTGVAIATLAAVERRTGDRRAAQEHAEQADPILVKGFGPQHDMTVWNEITLAELALDDGRAPAALEAFQKALAAEEKALGPTHGDLGRALLGIGESYLALSKPAQAIPALERAMSIQRQTPTAKYDGHAIEFALARALEASGGDRGRAAELAVKARDGYQHARARE
ncbi:MAG TPA: tetratricopeptide repeat protein, partial [Myxococcaceae bacterium]|nr:tetratricopeptide repeat protein [Myxococcaceae bacterium]